VPPVLGRYQADLWMTSYEASVFVAADRIGFEAASRRTIAEVA
jgi:hypothetical protein